MGQLLVKPGVDLGTTLTPAGARILEVLKRLVVGYAFDVTITSGRDSHPPEDVHSLGEAFDLRTHTLSEAQKYVLLNDLRRELYRPIRRFYAFLEDAGGPNEHLHVQRRLGTMYQMDDYLRSA